MKLVNKVTGAEIKVGDKVRDFRNEEVTVTGYALPIHGGSEGQVMLKEYDGYEVVRYPSVIGARIIEE
jgi:hypothetical protein